MSWDKKFSDLKKADEERKAKEKLEAEERARRMEADRVSADKHFKEVVIPLFEEVASAANKNGFKAEVKTLTVQDANDSTAKSYVRGVHLLLSKMHTSPSRDSGGHIKIEHGGGASFTLDHIARGSGSSGGVSMDKLSRESLEELVGRVAESSFK